MAAAVIDWLMDPEHAVEGAPAPGHRPRDPGGPLARGNPAADGKGQRTEEGAREAATLDELASVTAW